MTEKLTIRNFGPIKDMSLELKIVNILIGDQSTGKSTIAKLLSVIKEVSSSAAIQLSINGNVADEAQYTRFFEDDFRVKLDDFGITDYLQKETFIDFNDSVNTFKYDNSKIYVKAKIKEDRIKNTGLAAYIPAYREAAALLKNDLNAIFAIGTTLPKIFYFFGQKFSVAKKTKISYDYKDVLGVEYKSINDKDIVVLKSMLEIEIEQASSAVNSGIPLLTVFDNAVESMHTKNGRNYVSKNCPYIIIEEPEMNCFPTTQAKFVNYFISKIKANDIIGNEYFCRLFITTHSPYILTAMNNLMFAYQTGQTNQYEVDRIIKKEYWINPNDVSAYMLLENGTCESILDSEGLIKAEKIDSVSGKLNKEFNEILDIELSIKK